MKIRVRDIVTLGLALFAMFFGSGNVIFPPFLGMQSGSDWFIGILGYLLVDILIAVFAVVVMAKNDDGLPGITQRLGKIPSEIVGFAIIMCIGPLICIPRAASVSYDMIVVSLFKVNELWISVIFTFIFFFVTWLFVIRPGKICDLVGNILTPLLILFLAIVIINGVVNPISTEQFTPVNDGAMKAGVQAGYQSMDLFGCLSFGTIVITTAFAKGYKTINSRIKVLGIAAFICLILLCASSIGMAYLGSQVTDIYGHTNISQAALVIEIALKLSQSGAVVIAILSCLACLTTAIGLSGGTAAYFQRYFKDKDQDKTYKIIVSVCCIFGWIVSNLGLTTIVAFANPILTCVFPVAVVLVILSWFNLKIKSNRVFIGAVLGAFLSNLLIVINGSVHIPFVDMLPLFDFGFGWVVPTIVGGIIGWIAGQGHDDRQKLRIWQLTYGNNNQQSKFEAGAN